MTVKQARFVEEYPKDWNATATAADPSDLSVSGGVVTFLFRCAEGGAHDAHAEWSNPDAPDLTGAAVDAEFTVEYDRTA